MLSVLSSSLQGLKILILIEALLRTYLIFWLQPTMLCGAALLDFDPEPLHTPTCPGKSFPNPGWRTWPDVASDGAFTYDSVLPAPERAHFKREASI
jgi:hypothetical protein